MRHVIAGAGRCAMTQLMTNLPSGSPEFKKLLTAGLVCVGAKVEYATPAIKKGAQPGPDDEVV
jgi:hypothetical protein